MELILEVEEGPRQNEVVRGEVAKGLKTSRRGCREREVLKKKAKERRSGGTGGECLPRSEQAVLSCSSSLCPR